MPPHLCADTSDCVDREKYFHLWETRRRSWPGNLEVDDERSEDFFMNGLLMILQYHSNCAKVVLLLLFRFLGSCRCIVGCGRRFLVRCRCCSRYPPRRGGCCRCRLRRRSRRNFLCGRWKSTGRQELWWRVFTFPVWRHDGLRQREIGC